MVETKVSRVHGYYSELKKLVENQNYAKVVKTCNKIIAEAETEVRAWQCKITALIHLGDFKEGLQSLKKCKVVESVLFEKAYCEYRLNDINAAWNTISAAPSNSTPRIKELQAQILYRLERYEECYAIYRDLVKTTSDQFDQERLANFSAVSVSRIIEGSRDIGLEPSSDATYEQLYNSGCELIARGKIYDAVKRLEEAESLCRTILVQQDGATEEEVNEEVAIIRVQRGHCLQLLGKEKEAMVIYNSVLKTKPDDPALQAVINNNIVSINREGNLFDSKKRLKTTVAPGLEHKLTSRQRGVIALNHCLLAYHTNQDELCEAEAIQIAKNFPLYAFPAAVIQAAQHARSGKLIEAAKGLKGYANQNSDKALQTILSAAQILLSHEAIPPVIELLLSLEETNKFRSGIVSALVVLFSATGKLDQASKLLREAVEWHQKNKSPKTQLSDLWRHASSFHLRNGDPQTAAATLQELRKLNPNDRNTLAQLISAYSKFDTAMAQSLSKELPDSGSIINNIDAEALEATFGSKYTRKLQGKDLGHQSPASPKSGIGASSPAGLIKDRRRMKKNKKKKVLRLPKNYIEGEEPDPERWLPRWQRKGYKKRRDRRNKDVMRGTQGVSSEASDKYDITKGGGVTTQRTGHIHLPSSQASGGYKLPQKKKGAKKKKGPH